MTGVPFARSRRRCLGHRGATLVEYAMGVALIALIVGASIRAVESSGEDKLADRGNSIGHPAIEGSASSTTSTSSPSPPPPPSSSTTTTAPSATVQTACGGKVCQFSLSTSPDPATVTWTINPVSGYTLTQDPLTSAISVTFTSNGERSIQAIINGTPTPAITVKCTGSGCALK